MGKRKLPEKAAFEAESVKFVDCTSTFISKSSTVMYLAHQIQGQ